jgi:ATP-binding cassette subfamily B protein
LHIGALSAGSGKGASSGSHQALSSGAMKPSNALAALGRMLTPSRRRELVLTLIVMLVGAGAEMLTVGAALGFLTIMAGARGGVVSDHVIGMFGLVDESTVTTASVALIGAAIILTAVRFLLLWLTQKFVTGLGRDLAKLLFARILRQPYSAYSGRHSADLIAGMEKIQRLIFTAFQPVMQGLVAIILALFIAALLFVIDPFAATFAAFIVSASYGIATFLGRATLDENGRVIASASTARVKLVREAMGSIRDILLDGSQPIFEARLDAIETRIRRAQAQSAVISTAPRYILDGLGIIALAIVTLVISMREGGLLAALPILGTFAIAAQRLLPLVQQIWLGWSQVTASYGSLDDVLGLLSLPMSDDAGPPGAKRPEPLPFVRELVFDNVFYRYPDGREALRGVSLAIRRGERIGISGSTGSGKSTLVDLLMGLLEPTSGEIRVDGRAIGAGTRRAWQANIAHVPQSIYLSDESIAANIAFGEPREIWDRGRIEEAVRGAQLRTLIDSLPAALDTMPGEGGVRLSGGQRQRIGVARALYRRPALLILDEATSALDEATEARLVDDIAALGRSVTMVIIAHRRSTLKHCDRIIRIEGGRID